MDPIGCREIKDIVLDFKRRGKTILLCSHLLADVEDICDRVAILHQGNLIKMGAVNDLLTIKDIIQFSIKTPSEEALSRIKTVLNKESEVVEINHPAETMEELFLETIKEADKN